MGGDENNNNFRATTVACVLCSSHSHKEKQVFNGNYAKYFLDSHTLSSRLGVMSLEVRRNNFFIIILYQFGAVKLIDATASVL